MLHWFSVKRTASSLPQNCEFTSTGTGCQLWDRIGQGDEWSPVMASTLGFFSSSMGRALSTFSITFTFVRNSPSSPAWSVPFTCMKKKSYLL